MNLQEHFAAHATDMKDIAAHLGRPPEVIYPGLWQAITGPAGSGKVMQANTYAAMLGDEGFVAKFNAEVLSFNISPVPSDIEDTFARAKGGVLIIEDPHKVGFEKQVLIEQLAQAHEDSRTVVVMTGPKKDIDDFISLLPRAIDLMPVDSMQTFDGPPASQVEALKRRVALQEQKEDILKWKAMPKVDVSIGKPVKALRTVRFHRPEPLK